MNETVDRRVLGALQFVDAVTNGVIEAPLGVHCAGWTIRPNKRGTYVIFNGPGLNALTDEFIPNPSTWPPPVQLEISVSDASGAYLPRRAQITGVPEIAPTVQSVTLFPSVTNGTAPNWSVVRASVVQSGTASTGLPWAYLRITTSGGTTPLSAGLSDARGEALLAVTGLKPQITASGTGYTSVTTAATVQAWFDPAFASQPASWVPNPDDLINNLSSSSFKTATQPVSLAPRLDQWISIPIAI